MKISGVYVIKNKTTDECYVGSSKDVEMRWKSHKCPSALKKNPNSLLYKDMERLGIEAFTFEVLEECEPLSLFEREKYWIETLKPTYNVGKVYAHNKQALNPGIYKITNNITGDFYIGSSRNVKERIWRHRKKIQWERFPNNPLYIDFQKYGLENFSFEQILSVPDDESLKEIEQEYIELLKPTYNRVNAFKSSAVEKEERDKRRAYIEAHQDEIKAKKKEYYEANKERLRAQKQAYWKENRERLVAQKRDYYETNREALLAKKRAYRKENREMLKVYFKERYKANKEKYKAQRKEYRSIHRDDLNTKCRKYYEANKEKLRKQHNEYLRRKCMYNGEELTLNALRARFEKQGIPHPTLEAKKYLIDENKSTSPQVS